MLRTEVEPAVASPSLTRAALFAPPRASDVVPKPVGPRPARDDDSVEAQAYLGQLAAHEAGVAKLRQYREAGQM